MAKAASPVRLDQDLMLTAALEGKISHRSAVEQVEHWASLGRIVSSVVDRSALMSLISGTAKLKVEMVRAPRVDPDAVQQRIDRLQQSGTASGMVTGAKVKYQASSIYPGYLEQIDENGEVLVGQFSEGVFVPVDGKQDTLMKAITGGNDLKAAGKARKTGARSAKLKMAPKPGSMSTKRDKNK